MTLWDIPVLEPDWPRLLEERTQLGPVVALLGFADRATVRQARASGAAACLDLPVDVNDLVHVIERVNRKLRSELGTRSESRIEPAHAVPPAPASRAKRGRAAIRQRQMRPPLWSEDPAASTINNEKPA
jgi:DNA-binding NarL/FixJ family response regulator